MTAQPRRGSYPPDVLRTAPDFVTYVPRGGRANDTSNQHFLAVPSWSGAFLAVWTQSSIENNPDQRVVFARSDDRGAAWTDPIVIDGPRGADGRIASWGFPVLAPELRRLYVFYNKNVGVVDVREDTTGAMAFKYSDDEGATWSERRELRIERSAISPADPQVPENWICYQTPILNPHGVVMCGFTRWAATSYHEDHHLFQRHSECWFLRFDNILTEPDPRHLRVSTWPSAAHGIRVAKPGDPKHSIAQEPSIQNLDGERMICLMRSLTGHVWYATSGDAGDTWSPAEVLRFKPGGDPVPNPISPCPLYKLEDGRFLLIFHNNDGTANGGAGPGDSKTNRRPAWFSIGRTIDNPSGQPLVFGPPRILADNGGIELPPVGHTQVGTYGSFFEFEGAATWWYPDRKYYLLGKVMDEVLA